MIVLAGSEERDVLQRVVVPLRQPQELPPQLEQVKTLGELRVVTRNSPTTYFIGKNGLAGFEYDLTALFAREWNLRLAERGRADAKVCSDA